MLKIKLSKKYYTDKEYLYRTKIATPVKYITVHDKDDFLICETSEFKFAISLEKFKCDFYERLL